jgi:hypothetical protein
MLHPVKLALVLGMAACAVGDGSDSDSDPSLDITPQSSVVQYQHNSLQQLASGTWTGWIGDGTVFAALNASNDFGGAAELVMTRSKVNPTPPTITVDATFKITCASGQVKYFGAIGIALVSGDFNPRSYSLKCDNSGVFSTSVEADVRGWF